MFFPIHPRTKASLKKFNLLSRLQSNPGMHCTTPVNYVRFMNLVFNCRMVLTDSGGVQEEAPALGKPVLVTRELTERPEAVAAGKGCCGQEADALKASYEKKVAYHTAAAAVKADMHKCCAEALEAGKGCCGHSADELKAGYEKKVKEAEKKVAAK